MQATFLTTISGMLFEAWLSHTMPICERLLAVLRARFWLHIVYQHIKNLSGTFPDLYST